MTSKYSFYFAVEMAKSALTRHLPDLFAVDSKGKERVWSCWVVGDTVHRKYGLVTGKKITSERTFKGKSIGKKNETSAEEQAWAAANQEWTKYIDKDYRPALLDDAGQALLAKVNAAKKETGGHNINAGAAVGACTAKKINRGSTCMVANAEVVIPMKAHVWELKPGDPSRPQQKVAKYFSKTSGSGKNIQLHDTPFFAQPKLDGWRARVTIQKGTNAEVKVVITSNSGKQYPWFSSLREEIIKWLEDSQETYVDLLDGLDGELFASELSNTDGTIIPRDALFSTISSICGLSRNEPHELEHKIQFHVFDLVDKSSQIPQHKRFEHLDRLFAKLPESAAKRVIRVQTEVLNSVEEVPRLHDEFTALGYEGCVLRSYDMKYTVGKRNPAMRKFKRFRDEEYQIIRTHLDPGVGVENFVWVLKTPSDLEFKAKPTGSCEEKVVWFGEQHQHIGKYLTVTFQEYTNDGVPRFPIAKAFRDAPSVD